MSCISSAGYTPLAGARTSSDWSPLEIIYIFRSVFFPPVTRVIKLHGRPPQPVHAAIVSCILHVAYAPVNSAVVPEQPRTASLVQKTRFVYGTSGHILCILYFIYIVFSIPIIFSHFLYIYTTSSEDISVKKKNKVKKDSNPVFTCPSVKQTASES